jgi:type III restriction enzyme
MAQQFFEDPILNSPYQQPAQHWELSKSGQPTNVIIERRRRSDLVSPIPPSKKNKGKGTQEGDMFADGDMGETYNPIESINGIRSAVESWRKLCVSIASIAEL